MNKKLNHPTEKTWDDDYVNTQNWHPFHQTYPEMSDRTEVLNNKKTGKIFISALIILLMLGALSTVCVVGILYYNKVVSYELLSEQYANVTATLMMDENKATKTQRLYEELIGICQQVREDLSACNAQQNRQQHEGEWKTLDLKSYFFSAFKRNWTQSRDYCVEKGGRLVIITSQAEQDLVSSQIGETHWIGLNDLETEGVWMWVNNQPLKKTGVMFWYDAPKGPHEPDNWKVQDPSGENCVALGDGNGNTHKWFDASCRKFKKFICEK
ncbi:CD209 antigen-like protein C [Clarias gariepinus]|uniref:CD209 antigen-like protein E n=1 Tax=Clarias gariepinus TaxID=13013 RepID=UPI00234CA20F|nr:CD209 antigen-like protein E [Clarias gariepinus]